MHFFLERPWMHVGRNGDGLNLEPHGDNSVTATMDFNIEPHGEDAILCQMGRRLCAI